MEGVGKGKQNIVGSGKAAGGKEEWYGSGREGRESGMEA